MRSDVSGCREAIGATVGVGCVGVALEGAYIASKVSGFLAGDDKPIVERVVGTTLALLEAVPTNRAGDVFKQILDSLEP